MPEYKKTINKKPVIYAVGWADMPPAPAMKIGYSNDFDRRLRAHQHAHWMQLKVYHLIHIPHGMAVRLLEQAIHQKLDSKRIVVGEKNGPREWFSVTPDEAIEAMNTSFGEVTVYLMKKRGWSPRALKQSRRGFDSQSVKAIVETKYKQPDAGPLRTVQEILALEGPVRDIIILSDKRFDPDTGQPYPWAVNR